VFGEVQSRSPSPRPAAMQAVCSAAVPLATATAWRTLQCSATVASNRSIAGP
jgi:NADPH:quinone reductase-like Zn-dependent oxidoreductase